MQHWGILTTRNFYILGLLTIAASLPLSAFFTSIGQWFILIAWIADKNFVQKVKSIRINKALLFFLSFYLLHIVSLLWTSNYQYGLHDIKIKLPLLILPLIISTSKPLNKKEILSIFWVYCLAVLTVSMIGFYSIFFKQGGLTADFRAVSPFISHIRFALMINIAIIILLYIAFENQNASLKIKILNVIIVLYLMLFLILMRSLTGIVVFMAMGTLVLLYKINQVKLTFKRRLLNGLFIAIAIVFALYITGVYAKFNHKANENLQALQATTVNGNKYKHDTISTYRENGYLIYINICDKELETEWNKRSNKKYHSISSNGYSVNWTLIRYMSSLGLTKDSLGMSKLDKNDINAVEEGIANHIYLNRISLYPRLYELFWEFDYYKRGGNPSGHSVIQRFYYFTAGWNIFLENPIVGVGVGDVEDGYQAYYNKTDSLLTNPWRLRAHNQYLTILLSFGVIGFIIFLGSQIYPVLLSKKNKTLFILFTPLFITLLLSMLNEDTLETQAGVSFYAFFYSLFVWGINKKNIYDHD